MNSPALSALRDTEIVFWQNIPSIHQAAVIKEISAQLNSAVRVVTEQDLPEERRKQGWQMPDFGNAEVLVGPSREQRAQILNAAGGDAVHIFSGIQAFPETYWTFKKAVAGDALVGVYAEPVDDRGWRGPWKRALYRTHAMRWGARLDFMLVTGSTGQKWLIDRGFRQYRIFPYGYFVTLPDVRSIYDCSSAYSKTARFEWIFVGQLLPHKGLDILLNSLSEIIDDRWRLCVIGAGRDESKYRNLACQLGLAERVEWIGAVSNDQVLSLMNSSDATVLPSRYDGWGAVVNESLAVGTPVLVSNCCGAAELVASGQRGEVFKAGSGPALTAALRAQLDKGIVSPARRTAIRKWAASSIAPAAAAAYLLGILAHIKDRAALPDAPWLMPQSVQTGAA